MGNSSIGRQLGPYIFNLSLLILIGSSWPILAENGSPTNDPKKTSAPVREEFTEFYRKMVTCHLRMEPQVRNGTITFLGDSLTQAFLVSSIFPNSVNYGIGGDTTLGLLQRIPKYQSLKNADLIVVCIGVNDLKRRENEEILSNLRKILEILPSGKRILFNAIFPVDEKQNPAFVGYNSRILKLNAGLKILCENYPNILFLNVGQSMVDSDGNLKSEMHTGDGLHLSAKGYEVWGQALTKATSEAR